MIEFYPEIKFVHVAAALTNGALLVVRGFALNLGAAWAMAPPLRYLGYGIDMTLLTAALMLMAIVQQYPFVHSWVTAKVVLLIVYVALGFLAFRERRRLGLRLGSWLAALAVYAFIVTVARARHPLGVFSGFVAS